MRTSNKGLVGFKGRANMETKGKGELSGLQFWLVVKARWNEHNRVDIMV
jgi:hypothetical protein